MNMESTSPVIPSRLVNTNQAQIPSARQLKEGNKSSIGIKPSTLERIASPKKGLHNFGNKRRSMEVDCTNKLKIAPFKGLKLDNIFTYSRKPKNTPMAKLINLSCENPSLERIKTMKKTCIKLQKWVKSHAKSRSQDFHIDILKD